MTLRKRIISAAVAVAVVVVTTVALVTTAGAVAAEETGIVTNDVTQPANKITYSFDRNNTTYNYNVHFGGFADKNTPNAVAKGIFPGMPKLIITSGHAAAFDETTAISKLVKGQEATFHSHKERITKPRDDQWYDINWFPAGGGDDYAPTWSWMGFFYALERNPALNQMFPPPNTIGINEYQSRIFYMYDATNGINWNTNSKNRDIKYIWEYPLVLKSGADFTIDFYDRHAVYGNTSTPQLIVEPDISNSPASKYNEFFLEPGTLSKATINIINNVCFLDTAAAGVTNTIASSNGNFIQFTGSDFTSMSGYATYAYNAPLSNAKFNVRPVSVITNFAKKQKSYHLSAGFAATQDFNTTNASMFEEIVESYHIDPDWKQFEISGLYDHLGVAVTSDNFLGVALALPINYDSTRYTQILYIKDGKAYVIGQAAPNCYDITFTLPNFYDGTFLLVHSMDDRTATLGYDNYIEDPYTPPAPLPPPNRIVNDVAQPNNRITHVNNNNGADTWYMLGGFAEKATSAGTDTAVGTIDLPDFNGAAFPSARQNTGTGWSPTSVNSRTFYTIASGPYDGLDWATSNDMGVYVNFIIENNRALEGIAGIVNSSRSQRYYRVSHPLAAPNIRGTKNDNGRPVRYLDKYELYIKNGTPFTLEYYDEADTDRIFVDNNQEFNLDGDPNYKARLNFINNVCFLDTNLATNGGITNVLTSVKGDFLQLGSDFTSIRGYNSHYAFTVTPTDADAAAPGVSGFQKRNKPYHLSVEHAATQNFDTLNPSMFAELQSVLNIDPDDWKQLDIKGLYDFSGTHVQSDKYKEVALTLPIETAMSHTQLLHYKDGKTYVLAQSDWGDDSISITVPDFDSGIFLLVHTGDSYGGTLGYDGGIDDPVAASSASSSEPAPSSPPPGSSDPNDNSWVNGGDNGGGNNNFGGGVAEYIDENGNIITPTENAPGAAHEPAPLQTPEPGTFREVVYQNDAYFTGGADVQNFNDDSNDIYGNGGNANDYDVNADGTYGDNAANGYENNNGNGGGNATPPASTTTPVNTGVVIPVILAIAVIVAGKIFVTAAVNKKKENGLW